MGLVEHISQIPDDKTVLEGTTTGTMGRGGWPSGMSLTAASPATINTSFLKKLSISKTHLAS